MRLIALSDEFAASWGQKVKRPHELIVSALRAVDARVSPTDDFIWYVGNMGQPLFGRLTPDGYPDVRSSWMGTADLLSRWSFAQDLTHAGVPGATVDLLRRTPSSLRTPAALAAYWMTRLLGRPLTSDAARAAIVEAFALGRPADQPVARHDLRDRLPNAIALIMMAPDFQWR